MAEFFDMKSNVLTMEMKVSSALKQRRIFLSNEIDRDSLFEVSYFLYKLQDIDKRTGKKEPIEIVICSYGGYIYDGSLLVSQIEQMKDDGYEIVTTTSGYGMSMAFIIGLVGSKRQAYRYCRFMCHQPSSGNYGTLQQQENDLEETKFLWNQMKDIIIKNSKITDEQLEECKKLNKDWYLSPTQALELGIIDVIL